MKIKSDICGYYIYFMLPGFSIACAKICYALTLLPEILDPVTLAHLEGLNFYLSLYEQDPEWVTFIQRLPTGVSTNYHRSIPLWGHP
jgi:hypothetical protein